MYTQNELVWSKVVTNQLTSLTSVRAYIADDVWYLAVYFCYYTFKRLDNLHRVSSEIWNKRHSNLKGAILNLA